MNQDDDDILGDLQDNRIAETFWPTYKTPITEIKFCKVRFLRSTQWPTSLLISKMRDGPLDYRLQERSCKKNGTVTESIPLKVEGFKSRGTRHYVALANMYVSASSTIYMEIVWCSVSGYFDVWIWKNDRFKGRHMKNGSHARLARQALPRLQ